VFQNLFLALLASLAVHQWQLGEERVEIHDDDQDRLMDMLLREQLGGERPPQLAERIVKRANEERARAWRPRFTPAWVAAFVAAAMIAFVIVPRFFSSPAPEVAQPQPKPVPVVAKKDEPPPPEEEEPEPEPPFAPKVAEKIIRTEKQERTVELGGFCRVTLAPFSVVENKAEGVESKEQRIVLKEGSVACEVDSKKGKFSIEHALGTIEVTGTNFRVESVKKEDRVRRLTIHVKHGAVLFHSPNGEVALSEGQSGGALVGVVVSRGREFVEVRAEGEEQAKKYKPQWIGEHGGGLDRRMLERIADLKQGMRVRMVWKFEEHDRVIGIERLPEEKREAKPENRKDAHEAEKKRDAARPEGDKAEPAKRPEQTRDR